MQRWIVVTALTTALVGLSPAAQAAPVRDGEPSGTVISLGEARIDPKIPSRVLVDATYLCSAADEARSLTVSVEQKNPEDAASTAFGSARTAEADITCDGNQQQRQFMVQSKTSNWLPDVDAVVIATVSNIGSTPSAAADSRRMRLAAS
ncbi:hypothetical protein AB0O91_13950 [Kitasatospora sp. NPDC089797]|uniref:hypothetical protein n=1 Tax=Kitasatospora sp. NPDC089797 TaxID=3155298 RepID=UPI003414A25A